MGKVLAGKSWWKPGEALGGTVSALAFSVLALCLAVAAMVWAPPAAGAAESGEDPYLWLEEVEGDGALAWVEEQNGRTLAFVEGHRGVYEPTYQRLLAAYTSDDRIAYPEIAGGYVYNVWTDAAHPRGLWRRAPLESYTSGAPDWEDLLDVGALAEAEGVNWAFGGTTCLPPGYERCLVFLSRGGADSVEVREFDVRNRAFVPGGFSLPEAKTAAIWVDEDNILVATDWGSGTLTSSGYPFVVKRLGRGMPLSEAAVVFEGGPTDMGVGFMGIGSGGRHLPVVAHARDFYHHEYYLFRDGQLVPLAVPSDAGWLVVADQLAILLKSDWQVGEATYRQGSVIATGLEDFLDGRREFEVLFVPGSRTVVEALDATAGYLLVSVLDNVSSKLYRFRYDGAWGAAEQVPIPEAGAASVVSTGEDDNRAFLAYSSYLQPPTLYLMEGDGSLRLMAQLPDMFDREGLVVEQHEAISRDGTAVPYFVVRRKDLEFDGTNPTLLYGYGGFGAPLVPAYPVDEGVGWLEGYGGRGGVYVVANIRGGGEFGPAWHRAAVKENRQRAYDDFIAVAEDLVRRGITSPRHLGIMGGSNGGLLVGVALTQRPDLFGAVVSAVPLLDMRRYHLLLAGASWIAEYGDPDRPEDWAYISRYSPYHNVHPGRDYPPILFETSTRDDRVHPGHARKMAAKMQAMGHPAYYLEQMEGGHGAAVTPAQRAELWAATYTFLWAHLE